MAHRLLAAAPYICLLSFGIFLLKDPLFHGKILLGSIDRVVLEMPFLRLGAQALEEFSLPFWNSRNLCGDMALGQPAFRFLYPLNLLISLLAPSSLEVATSWRIVLEVILSLILPYIFFLKVWRSRSLAFLSAGILALSVPTALSGMGGPINHAYPALVLFVLWDWEERSFRLNVVLLSLVLFLQMSAGFIQVNAYLLLMAFALSIGRCFAHHGGEMRPLARLLGLWACAGALALMLDSFELVPFLHMRGMSNRLGAPYGSLQSYFLIPWYMVLRFIFPYFPGDLSNWPVIEGNHFINSGESFNGLSGVGVFLLCLFAFQRPRRRDVLPGIILLGLLALAALRTPFAVLPYRLFMRSPLAHCRLSWNLPYVMAFLAPIGLRIFMESAPSERRRLFATSFLIAGALCLFCSGLLPPPFSLQSWLPLDTWASTLPPDIPTRLRLASTHFALVASVVFAALGVHAFGLPGSKAVVTAIVALILTGDLAYGLITRHLTLTDGGWYPDSAITRFLQGLPDKERYRFAIADGTPWSAMPYLSGMGFRPNANLPYGLQHIGGYSNFLNMRYYQLATKGMGGGFRDIDGARVDCPELADFLAVKYLVARDTPQSRQRYSPFADLLHAADGAVVYAKRDPVPRFRLACRAVPVRDSVQDQLRLVREGKADLRDTVLLSSGDRSPKGDHSKCRKSPEDELALAEVRPGLIRGRARLKAPGLLVATDTFIPGWEARVNGEKAPILRANYAFQALELPAGESSVEMRFRFVGFPLAAALTLAAAMIIAGLLAAPAAWAALRRLSGGA